MKKKNLLMTAVASVALTVATMAQTWNLLIPSSEYDILQLSFSKTAFNQNNSFFYSVYKNGSSTKIQLFNLNSNSVSEIITSSHPPVNLGPFTYDYTNDRLIANRTGRENVYAVSAAGGGWAQIGNGSGDSQSFGASFFWNSSNSKVGFFGGYGLNFTRNWIWENNSSWTNPYLNNTICDNSNPAKRSGYQYALGDPSSNQLYLFSGYGSCSGNQNTPSCSLGSPWANDIGVYCWLKDLWEINLTTHQFTNILPVNSSSISKEGQIVYDYTNNTFYILGGFIPPATYDPNFGNTADFETGVLRFRVGIDSGFTQFTVGGTPPPTVKINNLGTNAAYYDALNNQIVWARKDGVWSFNTCEQPTQPATACYETTAFNTITCQWDIAGSQPTQPTTACYETATFNTITCQWDIAGSQPTQPTTACYETATFNTITCQWDVIGSPASISQATNQTINANSNAQFVVSSTDPNATYQWQTNVGLGFQNLTDAGQYSGSVTNTLNVANVTLSNNNQQFRCIIASGSCSDTSDVALLSVMNNVGIEEQKQQQLLVYPNPVSSTLTIENPQGLISNFVLVDAQGREVLKGSLDAKFHSFHIAHLTSGIYTIIFEQKSINDIKIIKE